jgi:hypothetical protein
MAFNADGRRLVTAGRDERLIVWDPARPAATEILQARRGVLLDLAVAPDGRTAFSAGRDGTVISWDLDGGRRLDRPFAVRDAKLRPSSVAAPTHGTVVAAPDAQGFVDVFDTKIPHLAGRIPTGGGPPGAAAVSPDGRTVAAVAGDGDLGLWDLKTLRPLAPFQTVSDDAVDVVLAFSGDGRWLASGGGGNVVTLWEANRLAKVNTITRGVADLSLRPDGKTLAATLREENFGGGLELLSVPDLEVIRTVPLPLGVLGRFTADGRSLVYADTEGRVWVYDTATWKPRGRPLLAHGPLIALDTSADGRLLATTSIDGTTRLWDLASGEQIGPAMSSGQGDMVGAAFVGGGDELALMHATGGLLADLRPSSWEEEACDIVGRTLTRAEWQSALPDRPYAPACT